MLQHYPDPWVDSHPSDSRLWWRAWLMPELRIVLSADGVEVFLLKRPWLRAAHTRLLAHAFHPVSHVVEGCQPDNAVLTVLEQVLAQYRRQHLHAVVVLSNQYVRWLVLPWQAQLVSKADRTAYCQHVLQRHFGEPMHDWQVAAPVAAYHAPSLVNALPSALSARLQAMFAEYQLPLGAIYPAWMLSANQGLAAMRQRQLRPEGWIVCRETQALTVACLQQGHWQSIRYLPVGQQWRQTLQQALLREQVLYPERTGLPVWVSGAQAAGTDDSLTAMPHVREMLPRHDLGERFNRQWLRRMA